MSHWLLGQKMTAIKARKNKQMQNDNKTPARKVLNPALLPFMGGAFISVSFVLWPVKLGAQIMVWREYLQYLNVVPWLA
jgi:hypothetical protein